MLQTADADPDAFGIHTKNNMSPLHFGGGTKMSRESPFSLTQCKSSLLHCIPSLRLLAFIVPEKSVTKNLTQAYMERRENKGTNEQIVLESPLSLT